MGKKEQIAIRLPPAAIKMVDSLIGSVLGTNRGDVARSLILDHLKHLSAQKLVEWVVTGENDDDPPSDG